LRPGDDLCAGRYLRPGHDLRTEDHLRSPPLLAQTALRSGYDLRTTNLRTTNLRTTNLRTTNLRTQNLRTRYDLCAEDHLCASAATVPSLPSRDHLCPGCDLQCTHLLRTGR
jgi:uncharacterized protein YjbI with pentapeptide repeats